MGDTFTSSFLTAGERTDPGRTQKKIPSPSKPYDFAKTLQELVAKNIVTETSLPAKEIGILEHLKPCLFAIAKGKCL